MKKLLFFILIFISSHTFGQLIPAPIFSNNSGFYDNDFYLKISHVDNNVLILYTLDGSEPKYENVNSPQIYSYKKSYPKNIGDDLGILYQDSLKTFIYNDSLLIKDRSNDPDRYSDIATSYLYNNWYVNASNMENVNNFKATTVRAVAFINGQYSEEVTSVFIVSSYGVNRFTLPVLSINFNADKFYGYENGLNVPGKVFDDWRINNPDDVLNIADGPGNFRASGSSSEFKVRLNYFDNGIEVLNQNVGIRNHGNGSRFFANRSHRFYAKSSYGTSNMNYQFFKNYPQTDFKRLVLRNSGQDAERTLFLDAFITQAAKNTKVLIQEYQPVIVLMNSEYSGIYNLRERIDDKYFEQIYDIAVSELDLIENNGLVEEGDLIHFNSMMDFLENNSLIEDANYAYIKNLIDIENFTDYMIVELFSANSDWPGNNVLQWRKKVDFDSLAPFGHDGKWRWFLKDLDYSFGNSWGDDKFGIDKLRDVLLPSGNRSTLLFRKLIENEFYKTYFITRYSDLLNSTLLRDRLTKIIDSMALTIKPEMQEHITRWNPNNEALIGPHPVYHIQKWDHYVQVLRDFAAYRPAFEYNYLKKNFNLNDRSNVFVNVPDSSIGIVNVNTLEIKIGTDGIEAHPRPWLGSYFKDLPLRLEAKAKEGYIFSHWSGDIIDSNEIITFPLLSDIYIKANFVEKDLSVDKLTSNEQRKVEIYPNPFEDQLNVFVDEYNLDYSITALDGKMIQSGHLSSSKLDVSYLEKGTYLLTLYFKDKTLVTQKIVK